GVVACRFGEDLGGGVQRVGVAEVQPGVTTRDPALQVVGRALGDQATVVEDGDAVGKLVGLLEVLGGEEDGDPRGDEFADDLPHGVPAPGVQAGGRLVEEDDPRVADKGHGEVQPAPHATRVGRDHLPSRAGQVEPVEQFAGAAATFAALQVVALRHQHQVL